MNKTKIDWCDYSWNPIKGLCPVACPYCYARRLYKRYGWDETIRYDEKAWINGTYPKEPSKIFVGSTMELFGKWVEPQWLKWIFQVVESCPQHTFIFLTKQPQNLPLKFPNNCWIGVSTTGFDSRSMLEDVFPRKLEAKVKFVSIEPLLDYSPMDFRWVDWVIVGQCTPVNKKTRPQNWAIDSIIENTKKEGKPLFIKNNIISDKILNPQGKYNIQEFPIVGVRK